MVCPDVLRLLGTARQSVGMIKESPVERMPERLWAVRMMRSLDGIRRLRVRRSGSAWPVLPGSYVVADPDAPVAVCTLADEPLMRTLARLPGVAIAGRLHTANLGIEKIITNVTANPRIRFLVLCGRDSPLFAAGQTLAALATNGVDAGQRVIGATGYTPVLRGIPAARVQRFRDQIELVDRIGDADVPGLESRIGTLVARDPGPLAGQRPESGAAAPAGFTSIRPGGRRRDPLGYDPAGYVVITLDQPRREILLRHYHADHTPAHEMRGHSAEPMLAGLLRHDLVTQLSHAGYLGAELAKAEIALRLGWPYEQDRPLRAPRQTGQVD
jgi:tetrahydromethanopterin S-methyltransferase subunit A